MLNPHVCSRFLSVMFITLHAMGVTAQGTAINDTGAPPHPSAMLDVSGASKGVLINRMTTEERNAIASPPDGLMLFNTSTRCLEIYIDPIWLNVRCGCTPPAAPSPGTHAISSNQITWYWNWVPGADGYRIGTTADFSSATEVGMDTFYTMSGLSCQTAYTVYVWAYNNSCSQSEPAVMTATSGYCCGNPITFSYNGSSVTYGTVAGQNGTCWMDRNLGAQQAATAYNDPQALGHLFQWGRGDDGHQVRNSPTTFTQSATDTPGNNSFILVSGGNLDWRTTPNNNLWQGASGINNPCPSGWRLPDVNEMSAELYSWSPQNFNGAYASPLKWTAAGYRGYWDGSVLGVSGDPSQHNGYYWTYTTHNDMEVRGMFLEQTGAMMVYPPWRANGCAVRCIKDNS